MTAFRDALLKSLQGERGHLPIVNALSDIDMVLASKRKEELPYSIYQLVQHMIYWQDFLLQCAKDTRPALPKSVSESWPTEEGPESEEAWQQVLQHFFAGLEQACLLANTLPLENTLQTWPGETPGGVLRNIASHNSYHLGEIVLIRRLFAAWPPPTGGYPA